jgi:DNA polymerase-3 subunit delta'
VPRCPYFGVPIIELYGHEHLRERLVESVRSGTLPASLLFQGPRGVGKQRLALWLAQGLLCTQPDKVPADGSLAGCGQCVSCRYVASLTHPDLHWIFPRPRLKDSDPDLEQVRDDYAEAVAERAASHGLYAAPSGSEGIYVATVRSIVQRAAISPAIGRRKVFIVGDAERMVPQEGADMAANAFLKLLEEPPADTTIVLTSSEPGALLPTIKSRVVTVRVPLVADKAVRAFVENAIVKQALDAEAKGSAAERVRTAAGAPGRLFSGSTEAKATMNARRIVDAATGLRPTLVHSTALAQGSMGARGAFSDTLDALVELLGERVRDALHRKDLPAAASAAKAVDAVLQAQTYASGNVSPQLVTSKLIRDLSTTLR